MTRLEPADKATKHVMKDLDQVTMTIEIGGQFLMLSTAFNRQNFVRDTEEEIASQLAAWKKRYPDKTDRELLAMAAYKYAAYYRELQEGLDRANSLADDCLSRAEAFLTPSNEPDA